MTFIVLGETEGVKTSKRIIGRYKSYEELRDVFETSKLTKPARKLLVFRVADPGEEDAWYLVSFDIGKVVGPRSGVRRATKEYSVIKYLMWWSLCGRIDNSTYICPDPLASDIPKRFTDRVEVWSVKPFDSKTLERMREAVRIAVTWVQAQLLMACSRLRGRGIAKAKRMVTTAESILSNPQMRKVEKLVSGALTAIEQAKNRLRDALEARERRP